MPRTVSANVLDSPVKWFDGLKSDYAGVKRGRLHRVVEGLPVSGSHADYHYRSEGDYLRMIEIARDFERNDPVVGQGLARLTANVIQDGFTLDPQTLDPEVDKHINAKWQEWSEDRDQCDAQGEMTFKRMESMVFQAVIRDGDIWPIPLSDGTLKIIEGHRPRTPQGSANTVHGVAMDERRRRRTLYVGGEKLSPWSTVKRHEVKAVPFRDTLGRRQVFQVYNPRRVSQTRGVSACAPIVPMIGMHDDIQFANLVRQQVVSCYAVFRKRMLGFDDSTDHSQKGTAVDGRTRLELAPGQIVTGAPGEELEGFSPNVPNPQFFEHAYLILSFIAVNLDLPVQVLLLDPTKTNFSGWRGAIDQARMRYKQMQAWMVEQFHSEVYRWKVRQWLETDPVLQDAMLGGVNIFRHNWHPPAWAYIEPNKDALADDLIVSRGLGSRRRVLARRGVDYEGYISERMAEVEQELSMSMELAAKLNAKYGDTAGRPVDWREIAAPFLATQATASLSGTVDEQEEPQEGTEPDDDRPSDLDA